MSNLAENEVLHIWYRKKSIILELECFKMCCFQLIECLLFCGKIWMLLTSLGKVWLLKKTCLYWILFLPIFCFFSKTVYDKWCPFPFCHVPGSANYHVDTVDRYFSPRTPPVFMSPGGTKIKVSVGDTVTIPCKIHNKGKFWWNSFLKDCT